MALSSDFILFGTTLQKFGGASIIPRARRSIHTDCISCSLRYQNTMGRYGCRNENTNECNAGSSAQDCDEVDNVMSKMAKRRSPIPTGRHNERKNSLPLPETSEWHTSDDPMLSKSLPAYIKMDLNYRDETDNESDDQDTDNNTTGFPFQNESRNLSNNSNYMSPTLNSYRENNNGHGKQSNSIISILFLFLIAIIGVFIAYSNVWIFETKYFLSSIEVYGKEKFFNDLNNLGVKYRISDDSLLHLRTGISTISQRNDTASFVFVYDSENPKFNSILFDSFIEDMASAAARYLRNSSSSNRHLSMDSEDLDMDTHRELINKYRNVVDDFGLMLIKDVDRVPSKLAMAFHYYCDEFNPLVKRSAIFFTLDIRKCLNTSVQSPTHANIEKCLASKWTSVPKDNLGPLLTRVVNVVIDVTNVF